LQHRDIPRIRQAIQKVPGLEEICDHTALLDVEPVLTTTDRDALNTTQVQAHVPALFFSAIYKNVFAIQHGCHAYFMIDSSPYLGTVFMTASMKSSSLSTNHNPCHVTSSLP